MSYKVENIVRRGEIAFYKQFLLFLQCFPHLYIFSAPECGIVWLWVNWVRKFSVVAVYSEMKLSSSVKTNEKYFTKRIFSFFRVSQTNDSFLFCFQKSCLLKVVSVHG